MSPSSSFCTAARSSPHFHGHATLASGANPQIRHTRQTSTQSASQISPVEGLVQSINSVISLIDNKPQKGGWWLTFRTELRLKLKSTAALAANLSPVALENSATVQEATTTDAQEQVTPHETPSAHQAATAPALSITILDVETAVARAVERGLKDIHERLDAIPGATPNSVLPNASAHACTAHDHSHPPPTRALPQATERDIIVSLASVTSSDALRACSEAEIKATVDAALASTTPRDQPKRSVAGVRKLPNGDIRIRTSSESIKDTIVNESSSWLSALAPGAQLVRERYTVEVRAVPTTFRPDEDYAIQALYVANAETFASAASILAVRWLRDPGQDKRAASLLLDLDSMHAFHHAIYNGISIRGRLCDVCPRGDTSSPAARVEKKNYPSLAPVALARTPPAPVSAHTLPAEEVARRPKYARLLAAYASPPPSAELPGAAGDTRRSIPFSTSPRAGSAWQN
ncbi:hypothetical protein EXIGLDRAFT_754078 [Exidia glandulosa HHB12029]|uniref:Uncharacterized protein n=1 Tax=Exidia glandulosa HHB12029 TaxID=1314781 RepID=A0A165D938_EXIGL|nr:hypothetical protein EXIGLDRAFT_754078 [Exidia glandulosa HHB12029]